MDNINKLQQIGLTKRESEIYLALLQKKQFTATELEKLTTITRTKIYEILQNMIRKGVCTESVKNGQKIYKGIEPQIAFQNLINNYKIEIEQKKETEIIQKEQAAKSLQKELTELHRTGVNKNEPLDYVETLTNINQIWERWLKIQKDTKKELLMFAKAPYASSFEDNLKDERAIIKKGVDFKCIYEYGCFNSENETGEFLLNLEEYVKIGENVRLVRELPMKLAISDETVTMLGLNDRLSLKPSITTLIVDHPSFSNSLKTVFENYWSNSISFKEFKGNVKRYTPVK
jgi:sugar-specific transcriptional regulator TrmB